MQEMVAYVYTCRRHVTRRGRKVALTKSAYNFSYRVDQTSTVVHIKTNLTLLCPILKSSRVQEEV